MEKEQADTSGFPILRIDQIFMIEEHLLRDAEVEVVELIESMNNSAERPPPIYNYLLRQLDAMRIELTKRSAASRIQSMLNDSFDVYANNRFYEPILLQHEKGIHNTNRALDAKPLISSISSTSIINSPSTNLGRNSRESRNSLLPIESGSKPAETSRSRFTVTSTLETQITANNVEDQISTTNNSNNLLSSRSDENNIVDKSWLKRPSSGNPSRRSVISLNQHFGNSFVVGATEKKIRFFPKKVSSESSEEMKEKERVHRRKSAMKRLMERKEERQKRQETLRKKRARQEKEKLAALEKANKDNQLTGSTNNSDVVIPQHDVKGDQGNSSNDNIYQSSDSESISGGDDGDDGDDVSVENDMKLDNIVLDTGIGICTMTGITMDLNDNNTMLLGLREKNEVETMSESEPDMTRVENNNSLQSQSTGQYSSALLPVISAREQNKIDSSEFKVNASEVHSYGEQSTIDSSGTTTSYSYNSSNNINDNNSTTDNNNSGNNNSNNNNSGNNSNINNNNKINSNINSSNNNSNGNIHSYDSILIPIVTTNVNNNHNNQLLSTSIGNYEEKDGDASPTNNATETNDNNKMVVSFEISSRDLAVGENVKQSMTVDSNDEVGVTGGYRPDSNENSLRRKSHCHIANINVNEAEVEGAQVSRQLSGSANNSDVDMNEKIIKYSLGHCMRDDNDNDSDSEDEFISPDGCLMPGSSFSANHHVNNSNINALDNNSQHNNNNCIPESSKILSNGKKTVAVVALSKISDHDSITSKSKRRPSANKQVQPATISTAATSIGQSIGKRNMKDNITTTKKIIQMRNDENVLVTDSNNDGGGGATTTLLLSSVYENIGMIFPITYSQVGSKQIDMMTAPSLLSSMHFQLKLYQEWLEVMEDYATVYLDDDDDMRKKTPTDLSILGHPDNSKKLHFRVKSTRTEVCGIVTDVFHTFLPQWTELPSGLGLGTSWNLLWSWGKPRINMSQLLIWQRVNHFQDSKELTRKDLLKKNLHRYTCLGGKAALYFDIMPQTFILPHEYTTFVRAFYDISKGGGSSSEKEDMDKAVIPSSANVVDYLASSLAANHHKLLSIENPPVKGPLNTKNLWIMKPIGLSRGRGISLVSDVAELVYSSASVIQKYVEKPLCLGGYKFDLRLYVLVTSFRPLEAFIYKEGFARLSTQVYTLSAESLSNKFIHLTNSSIQKQNTDGPSADNPVMNGGKETNGSKIPLLGNFGLWARLREFNVDVDKMWTQICLLVIKSLVAVEDRISFQPCSFEVFGYDVLLDEDMRPWLLEVNSSPSLARENQLDIRVKNAMIKDTILLLNPAPYNRDAVAKVLQRRLHEISQNKIFVLRNDPNLESDLRQILGPNYRPRRYGEIPDYLGDYQPLSPNTKLYTAVMKKKSKIIKE